jgi:hypothetical protein
MSVSYFGFSRLPVADARRRIAFIREQRPEWFDIILLLYDADAPQPPFGPEIAREFIADPQSTFMLTINDKERFSAILRDALEFIYEVFGTDELVLTHQMEVVHPPLRRHPPMKM